MKTLSSMAKWYHSTSGEAYFFLSISHKAEPSSSWKQMTYDLKFVIARTYPLLRMEVKENYKSQRAVIILSNFLCIYL